MSYYSSKISAFNDTMLSKYLDDVEDYIGSPGIAEKVKRQYNWIRGKTSFWWLVQKAGIEKWLHRENIPGRAVFKDKNISYEQLRALINDGPVILQTDKMGGLRGGHIILAIDYNDYGIICHDPFGDAVTNYTDHDGDAVVYSDLYLRKYTGDKIRCIYWGQ
jgi:hypothetical protein